MKGAVVTRAFLCAAVVALVSVAALPVLQAPGAGAASPARGGPGVAGCEETRAREPQQRVERHPCGWVETCRVPCGREGAACCHAEWDCPPPEGNAPRC